MSESAADLPRVYRVDASSHAFRQVGDEGVVLDLRRSVYFALNRTAGILWPRLIAGSTRDELVDTLISAGSSGVDATQVGGEIDAFLADVEAQGLLTTAARHG